MKRIALLLAAFLAGVAVGQLQLSEPRAAWAVGSPIGYAFKDEARPITAAEAGQIELYLRRVLGNASIRVDQQPPEADVYVGGKFLGVVYPDENGGERSFYFEIAILGTDLEPETTKGSRKDSHR